MAANLRELDKIAYEAYCASTGGVSAVTGAPLPTWDDQAEPIRAAWYAAAAAVDDAVRSHFC